MSFGLHDKDWVDQDEAEPAKCGECEFWAECPCGCGWGWCTDSRCDFTKEDEPCV